MLGLDIRLAGLERNCSFSGSDTRAKPGDIRVYDLAQPFFVDNENFKVFSLWVNRSYFDDRLTSIEQLHGALLRGGPLQQVFKAHVGMVHEVLKQASEQEAEKLAAVTANMAAELLDLQSVGSLDSDVIGNHTVRRAINLCIRQFMSDPGLSPDFIARHVGVSRSKLYRLCKHIGTPMDVVRRVRLYEAVRLLKKGQVSHISNLAYTVGFATRQAFGRAFKTEFKMTPKEFLHELCKPPTRGRAERENIRSWRNVMAAVESANTKVVSRK